MPQKLFDYLFDGQEGQYDVGWQKAHWYDYKNIHIPIDHADGKPTHWLYWEAEGKSYDADNESWNRFKSPEQRFTWAKFLPEREHKDLLNKIGQSYNWFHGNSPFHSRLARPALLKKGKVQLSFEFYADWYKWEGGKIPKTEVSDSNGCRIELEIIDTGLNEPFNWDTGDEGTIRSQQSKLQAHLDAFPGDHDDWLIVNPSLGHTIKTKTIDVPRDGLYLLVFGVYTVWAVPDGKGRNGLFVLSLGAEQVDDDGGGTAVVVDAMPTIPTSRPAEPAPSGPVEPASTTPAATRAAKGRGAPRIQYERTFQLIHSSVPDNQAAQIFLSGFRQGKTTGSSADDAGIGDLDTKIVEVYGWPAAEQAELKAWYQEHYPGTQVRFMS